MGDCTRGLKFNTSGLHLKSVNRGRGQTTLNYHPLPVSVKVHLACHSNSCFVCTNVNGIHVVGRDSRELCHLGRGMAV